MSKRKVIVTVEADWQPTDDVVVYIGTENAADLAASTPSGGRRIFSQKVGTVAVGSDLVIYFDYSASDKCAALPVGLSVHDAAGNESAVAESILQIRDAPLPPGRPDVAATVNPGEATLTWLASPDL